MILAHVNSYLEARGISFWPKYGACRLLKKPFQGGTSEIEGLSLLRDQGTDESERRAVDGRSGLTTLMDPSHVLGGRIFIREKVYGDKTYPHHKFISQPRVVAATRSHDLI